jgi:hypothetical protein
VNELRSIDGTPINRARRFFLAIALAFVMAAFLPLFTAEGAAIYVPFPPGTKEFFAWCADAPNWLYILAGCWLPAALESLGF